MLGKSLKITLAYVLMLQLIVVVDGYSEDIKEFDLIGSWSGKALDGTVIRYEFAGGNKIIWFVDESNFKSAFPNGLSGKYEISPHEESKEIGASIEGVNIKLFDLTISDFENFHYKTIKFLGILTTLSQSSFKYEGRPSNVGARPTSFTNEAIIFNKSLTGKR